MANATLVPQANMTDLQGAFLGYVWQWLITTILGWAVLGVCMVAFFAWKCSGADAFNSLRIAETDRAIIRVVGRRISKKESLKGRFRQTAASMFSINPIAGLKDDTATWAFGVHQQADSIDDAEDRKLLYNAFAACPEPGLDQAVATGIGRRAEDRADRELERISVGLLESSDVEQIRMVVRPRVVFEMNARILRRALQDREFCNHVLRQLFLLIDYAGRGTSVGLLVTALTMPSTIDDAVQRAGYLTLVGGTLGASVFVGKMFQAVAQAATEEGNHSPVARFVAGHPWCTVAIFTVVLGIMYAAVIVSPLLSTSLVT